MSVDGLNRYSCIVTRLRWPHFQRSDWTYVVGVATLVHFLFFTHQEHPEVLIFVTGCLGAGALWRDGNGNGNGKK